MSERAQPGLGGGARLAAAIGRRDEIWLAALALLFFLFLLGQGAALLDADAYFHIRIAQLLSRRGFLFRLPWMALSIQADRYVDLDFLFHWLEVPFVLLAPDLITAAKVATATFAAGAVAAFVLLLRRVGTEHRWYWALFLVLGSPIFTGRWLFGRAGTLFTALVFLFLLAVVSERPRFAALVAAAAVWTYPGFPLLIVLAALYDASVSLRTRRLRTADTLAALGGCAVALVLHPGFPRQFGAYALELGTNWVKPPGLEAIAEWLPGDAAVVLVGTALPASGLAAALLARSGRSPLAVSLLAASVVLLVALALSVKSIEAAVPIIAAALAACSWRAAVPRAARRALAAGSLAVLALWSAPQLYQRVRLQQRLADPRPVFEVADWLAANTEEGSLVLAPWSEFPMLFFRSLHNRYPFGLNPAYAWASDPRRTLMLRAFFEGRAADPLETPRALGARYAVLGRRAQAAALARLLAPPHPGAEVAYQNPAYVIVRVPAAGAR